MSSPTPALLTEADVYDGDPLHPDLVTVTPPGVLALLTRSQRELRVQRLVEQAHAILDDALENMVYRHGRELAALAILYSGGNDSTVLAHLMRGRATHALHANTGIGVEATRQFVRDTCAAWRLPLIEKHAPDSYRDLVVDRGFPGPPMHYKMYQRLKERALEAARRDLLVEPRRQRVVYIAGRRRAESTRRSAVPLYEWKPKQSLAWVSPLAMWTKVDLQTYRLAHADDDPVPVNPVSEALGMSGECLCGAFAEPGELDEIGRHFPDVRAHIEGLEAEVRAAGRAHPAHCTWGHGIGKPSESGPLCSTCDARREAIDTIPLDEASPELAEALARIRARRDALDPTPEEV